MPVNSAISLPDAARALLDAPEFATLATIEPTGQPQLSVIWNKRDGDELLFATVKGRRKTVNKQRDGRVTVMVFAKQNPYRYLEVRGTVGIEDDPEGTLIDELSRLYKGQGWTADAPGTERVIVRLTPTKLVVH